MLYKELVQIDKLKTLQFFLFIPYLDENNFFYYSIIIGLKNVNYNDLNNLKFDLVKNIKFINLTETFFNYEFFKNLFNFKNNVFRNEDYRLIHKIITSNDNYNLETVKKFNLNVFCSFLFFYDIKMYYFLGGIYDIIMYDSKGWDVTYYISYGNMFAN